MVQGANLVQDESIDAEALNELRALCLELFWAILRIKKDLAQVNQLHGQELVKVFSESAQEQTGNLGPDLCLWRRWESHERFVNSVRRDVVDVWSNDSVKHLHSVAGAHPGEDFSQVYGLISLNLQSIIHHGLLEKLQKFAGDLTFIIHWEVGGSDADEVMHVHKAVVCKPFLYLLLVLMEEYW